MNFFTSDIHLGSEDIIYADSRPFKSTKAFNRYLVKNWNKQAKKHDVIYVVGDLFDYHHQPNYNWQDGFKITKKIKADIVLIVGNNEQRIIKKFFNNNFESFKNFCKENGIKDVYNNLTLTICNQQFYLTHKPIDHSQNMLTLFGHCHKGIGLYKSFGFNIGYDLNNFRLHSENDIQHLLHKKDMYWDKDENLKLI